MVDHLYACAGAVLPKEAVEAVALEDLVQVLEVVADEVHVVELVVVERARQTFEKMKAKGLGDWTREL